MAAISVKMGIAAVLLSALAVASAYDIVEIVVLERWKAWGERGTTTIWLNLDDEDGFRKKSCRMQDEYDSSCEANDYIGNILQINHYGCGGARDVAEGAYTRIENLTRLTDAAYITTPFGEVVDVTTDLRCSEVSVCWRKNYHGYNKNINGYSCKI